MFDRAIDIIGSQREPFFAEVLTLSNHFPFDSYPTDAQAPTAVGGETYVAYTRGIFYTDHALGSFMARARQQPWFDDTIFVITADHGLFLFPDQPSLSQVQRQDAAFRTPLLIYAPGRVKPGRRSVVGSQADVAPTILELLGIRPPNTFVGRSLLDDAIAADARFAILVQQSNWFLRLGNQYFYCGSPEDGEARELDSTRGYLEPLRGERTAIGFRTGADLLRTSPRDAELLDPTEVESRRAWAEEAIDVARVAIRQDWVLMDGQTPGAWEANTVSALAAPPPH
jgi:membrane-anchored protein YejM (alkaline phosphatase superfamily)